MRFVCDAHGITKEVAVIFPELFCERMKSVLGDDYPAFIKALETEDAVKGIRVNGCKISVEDFLGISDLCGEAIPYTLDGFYPTVDDGLGNTPEHHAGMIYVQDPGAMAALWATDIREGWWVADLCSAPGGKSAQAAARIGESGFLLSNEYVGKRAKLTVSNFERLGIKNAMVTSMDTRDLAKLFDGAFDLVITDVPCSGEGMFRKSEEAKEAWSLATVRACAERQKDILNNAATLVKGGGTLLYSTCTWSADEDEDMLAEFLSEHRDFHLAQPEPRVVGYTAAGLSRDGADGERMRRFYPHISPGEGQFFAVLKRYEKPAPKSTILYKDATKPLSKQEENAVNKFFRECFLSKPSGRVVRCGGSVVLVPHSCPIPERGVFMSGVLLGEIKGDMLFPSHQLASAYGDLFKNKVELKRADPRVRAYLHGEEISSGDNELKGWCCVTYEGVPMGLGKASSGVVKNHYPKGLRLNNSTSSV